MLRKGTFAIERFAVAVVLCDSTLLQVYILMGTVRTLTLTTRYQMSVVVIATLIAWLVEPSFAWGLLFGGLFASLNFYLLRVILSKTLNPKTSEGSTPKAIYVVLLMLKMLIGLAVLTALVLWLNLHPIALILGLATLMLGIFLATLHTLMVKPSPSPQG